MAHLCLINLLNQFMVSTLLQISPIGQFGRSRDDHQNCVMVMDSSEHLNFIVTASKDGSIRIWNDRNKLRRTIHLGAPIKTLTLADSSGDLIVAFDNS